MPFKLQNWWEVSYYEKARVIFSLGEMGGPHHGATALLRRLEEVPSSLSEVRVILVQVVIPGQPVTISH